MRVWFGAFLARMEKSVQAVSGEDWMVRDLVVLMVGRRDLMRSAACFEMEVWGFVGFSHLDLVERSLDCARDGEEGNMKKRRLGTDWPMEVAIDSRRVMSAEVIRFLIAMPEIGLAFGTSAVWLILATIPVVLKPRMVM